MKKVKVNRGKRSSLPADVADKLKALERESRELRQANKILRTAFAYLLGRARSPAQAMIALIDEHRGDYGRRL